MERKRIAVFIDFTLRIPSFSKTYEGFRDSMFNSNKDEFDTEEEVDVMEDGEIPEENFVLDASRFFWSEESKNPEIGTFYAKKKITKEDCDLVNTDLREYFYSEDHYKKFIEDYSFNLYGDGDLPYKKDADLLNIAQTYLFDVILIDEFETTRKKSNTFYYLSKIRVTPQAVLFLGPGQKVNEDTYFGVWNPKVNKDQVNKEGYSEFEMWLKDLEQKIKKEQ